VRLNHWAIGGDQGWQEIGAYPPYFIDCLPGILDVGRGSPTWSVFYEHTQLPEKFRDAFLVCDYRWKRESNDQYATTGRLVAFFLQGTGASWKATMETIVRPRPGARDDTGKPINSALVDVAVAPDGSLVLSDHNQGIWRLFYDAQQSPSAAVPALVPSWPPLAGSRDKLLDELVALPQPASERTRLRDVQIRQRLGASSGDLLLKFARDGKESVTRRLRALQLVAPDFATLPRDFLEALAHDQQPEIRGQAAWLFGIRGGEEAIRPLIALLDDASPFVRRRMAESLTRLGSAAATPALVDRLGDAERLVRYTAMNALAHRPTAEWFDSAVAKSGMQIRLRALTASFLRHDPPPAEKVRAALEKLLAADGAPREDRLDLLRVLSLFQNVVAGDSSLRSNVAAHLLKTFPDADRDLRWEQTRLLGEFHVSQSFGRLLGELERERDPVTQFHLAQTLARLPEGWTPDEEARAMRWILVTQRGWFAEFSGKGVEFPETWSTVLTEFSERHRDATIRELPLIDLTGALGTVALQLLASPPSNGEKLIALYRAHTNLEVRLKIVKALGQVTNDLVADFLQTEHDRLDFESVADARLGGAILQCWAERPTRTILSFLIYEGLFHEDPAVVRACANGLAAVAEETKAELSVGQAPAGREPGDDLAVDLISRMIERPDLFHALDKVLVIWSGRPRPGFRAETDLKRRPDEATRTAVLAYWKQWFEQRFHQKFKPMSEKAEAGKSDEEIHQFLLGDSGTGGDPARGATIYESLQCNSCHAGGVTPGREGRLFGPDLAGVTRRLSRAELADALVYPSKQVADRFKAMEVTLRDSSVLTGFITDQNGGEITLVDRDQVRRIARNAIASMQPQTTSLMPERLLNRLSMEEIRDLLAFLDGLGFGSKK
jgi:putative heme-binding domain-containing protein